MFTANAIVDVVKDQKRLDGIDGRVDVEVRIEIYTVEVGASLVSSVVAACHAIRVQERHKLENKLSPEKAGSWVVTAQNELEETVENER